MKKLICDVNGGSYNSFSPLCFKESTGFFNNYMIFYTNGSA